MKKGLVVWGLIFVLSMGFVPVRAQAQDVRPGDPLPCESPPGELIVVDTLVLRPLGVAACIIGLAGAVVALPFAAASNSADRVAQSLIVEPFQYTFQRPLGTLSYDPCEPRYDRYDP